MRSQRLSARVVIRAAAMFGLVTFITATDTFSQPAQVVVGGLQTPVAFARHPGDPAVWYVAQQNGVIWVIRNGVRVPAPFANLSGLISTGGERGLLGLAFPANYATTGWFFVYYTAGGASPHPAGSSVVSRFTRSAANPDVAEGTSRLDLQWTTALRYILMRDQNTSNHNGGCLAFGPDGYLYVSVGDSGGGGDPLNSAQDRLSLRGKILRIDVNVLPSNATGITIPPDNPFLDGVPVTAWPEVWAFGLRNPWKFSFDNPALGGTGAMLIGDVGQNAREEIDFQPAGQGGRNYGWANREGAIPFDPARPVAYQPLVPPIHDYDRNSGASVTGGYVYRGSRRPSERGRYFFADFISGRVWSFLLSGGTASNLVEHTAALGGFSLLGNVSGFGEDASGELYILNYTAGTIVAIHPLTAPANPRVVR
jgi:glucose/arabinose dehydrogenase